VKVLGIAVGAAIMLAGHAQAKSSAARAALARPAAAAAPRPARRPAPPLPMLPRVAKVTVEVGRDRVVVVEDVTLPRGDWQSGGLDLFVAFGAPGTPEAFDARIAPAVATPSAAGDATSSGDTEGEPVATESAVRRDVSAQPLLGPALMAGVVVRIKEAQLRRVYAGADAARLRLRSLIVPPAAGPDGAHDVVVRLGTTDGQPLTLGSVEVRALQARARMLRAEASLCGPEADAWPLSVTLAPRGNAAHDRTPPATTIAPELAVRHATDDLCVRWWVPR
jgi:hypothetical protein